MDNVYLSEFGEFTPDELALAQRIINEKLEHGMDQWATCTTGKSSVDETLTLEKLQQTISKLSPDFLKEPDPSYLWAGRVSPRWEPMLLWPSSGMLGGIPIYTSPYLGETVYPEPPAMKKGPYIKRRIKRWRRAHPPYTKGNGEIIMTQDAIWCHPDELSNIQKAILKTQQPVVENDLPWGLKAEVDATVPPGTISFRYGDREVGRIENIRPADTEAR
jgi:hypothetical protein